MSTPTTLAELVDLLVTLITDGILYILTAIIFIFVVWKIIDTFIINVDDETKRKEGKQTILAAVVFFVVFFSLWGIVTILRSSIFG